MFKYLGLLIVFAVGILIVSLQKHYFVDVILAWAIVPLVWDLFLHRYKDHIPEELEKMKVEVN